MKTLSKSILVLISIALIAGTAMASDGAIPLYQATSIGDSGSYRLTRDITLSNSTIFTVNAPNVTIDLAGHTLSAPGGTVFYLNADDCTLRVKNGSLRASYSFQTYMKTRAHVHATDLEIETTSSGTGLSLEAQEVSVHVERVRFLSDSADRAIKVQADVSNHGHVTIRDSFFGTTTYGTVYVFHAAGLRFIDNVIRGHGYSSALEAVYFSGSASAETIRFTGNEIALMSGSGDGLLGLSVDTALVADNLVAVPDTGIDVSASSSTLRGNTIDGAQIGAKTYNVSLVTDNVFSNCVTGLEMNGFDTMYRDNYFQSGTAVSGSGTDGGGNVGL
jgi:hypothetical protein